MDLENYRYLKIPIYDIRNIKVTHPENCPIGKIHLTHEASNIYKKSHFVKTARTSSISALHRLRGKPYIYAEIAFKLAEDVDQGLLMKLDKISTTCIKLVKQFC